jgi:phosphohistidine phosphatase
MKTLILTRHAKSSWDDLTMMDHDRMLNKRGRNGATAIGRWLAENRYLPEEVLCSTAARCQETLALVAASLPTPPPTQFIKRMYLPAPDTLYEVLKRASTDTVMMVAHNPGIAEFASMLLRELPAHPKFQQYPSGATTIITFDIPSWSTPFMGKGTATDFIVPRDLTE